DAGSAPLGGVFATTVYSRPGDAAFLIGGFPSLPLPTLWGDLWIDLSSLAVYDAGVVDATGRRQSQLPVPVLPALIGHPITFQSLAGADLNSALLAAPATVILR